MDNLDSALYQSHEIRLFEQQAYDQLNLPASELMERAGQSAFLALESYYAPCRLAVFCGSGNNAGDGYVLARLAHEKGWPVVIYQHKKPNELPATACHAAQLAIQAGVRCLPMSRAFPNDAELFVDALLGIGIQGSVHGPIADVINEMNQRDVPIVALDVPSGLNADTGTQLGAAIKADLTITFIALKTGLFTSDGIDCCGTIICAHLGLEALVKACEPVVRLLEYACRTISFPKRAKNSHKKDFGHVVVVGGGKGMPGAAYLSALAALRVGAGMVTVAINPMYANWILPGLPEVMVQGIETTEALHGLLEKASVCILGPGLGEDDWAKRVFNSTIKASCPLIVDASALRILADSQERNKDWILTPHPGEASKLLSNSVSEVQADRFRAAQRLQKEYGGCIILKGAGSVVHTGEAMYLCSQGNPGLATAGTGDVLSGILGGLIAQGLSRSLASQQGVWLHASAGDDAALKEGVHGLLASDLMPYIRRRVNQLTS